MDLERIRSEFPVLTREVNGRPLVYLDSAASAQQPTSVIEAMNEYSQHYHSNVHRGVHRLAQQATEAFEAARDVLRDFIGATDRREVIWTSGTTDGINLVAQSWGRKHIAAGDVILLTRMEHHANVVPWQMLAKERGARIEVVEVTDDGGLDWEDFEAKLALSPKLFAFAHVSNTLGTINDAKRLTAAAQAAGAIVLVDGAQAVPHLRVNVVEIGCDFYVFSAHKMYGPTGIGVLYGRSAVLEEMPPWRGGGEMIERVSFEEGTTYAELPHRLEAGTPPIAAAIATGVAAQWLARMRGAALHEYETLLVSHAHHLLRSIPGLRFIGNAPLDHRAPLLSFVVDGLHPYDIGVLLDQLGIAVRTGHHCTQPLMERFGIPGTVRASFAPYNTLAEVDAFAAGVQRAVSMLR